MVDQRTELAADALKERVRDHWQRETCGTRYGEAADRLTWFRDIARARQTLEPYIASFARFEEAAGKRILEIGVGAGSDFTEWCRHAEHATGIDLTEAAITLTTERLALEGVPASRFTLKSPTRRRCLSPTHRSTSSIRGGCCTTRPARGRPIAKFCAC